jgi:hypothetical protein
MGYQPEEIDFRWTWVDQAQLKFQRLLRGLTGRR